MTTPTTATPAHRRHCPACGRFLRRRATCCRAEQTEPDLAQRADMLDRIDARILELYAGAVDLPRATGRMERAT